MKYLKASEFRDNQLRTNQGLSQIDHGPVFIFATRLDMASVAVDAH